jgi:hypothetical protein
MVMIVLSLLSQGSGSKKDWVGHFLAIIFVDP